MKTARESPEEWRARVRLKWFYWQQERQRSRIMSIFGSDNDLVRDLVASGVWRDPDPGELRPPLAEDGA